MDGLNKKEKRRESELVDMDNSMVIAGGRGSER